MMCILFTSHFTSYNKNITLESGLYRGGNSWSPKVSNTLLRQKLTHVTPGITPSICTSSSGTDRFFLQLQEFKPLVY
jgi:hypothetical protein